MEKTIEEIYLLNKNLIYNYFLGVVFHPQIAEDLTQETFLKAFRYLNSYKGHSSIRTWLLKISKNIFLSYVSSNPIKYEESVESIDDYHQGSNNYFEEVENRYLINNILSHLSEKERSLLVLKFINDLTYKEIASILDSTEGNVKVGVFRAKNKCKCIYKNNYSGDL